MIWFILGPSGAGKSRFGEYLANNKDWYQLEIDQSDKDGIDKHGIRKDWDAYFCKRYGSVEAVLVVSPQEAKHLIALTKERFNLSILALELG